MKIINFFYFITRFGKGEKRQFDLEHENLLTEQALRKNAEQQMRIREHFIAVAAHELKTPLTSQKAYIQLLKRRATEDMQEYIQKIEEQNNTLTNFIDELMDVSKMTRRSLRYRFDYFDLSQCLTQAIDQVRNLLITHEVLIRGGPVEMVYGDRERILQVITNLLSNAIKYSPEAQKIIISLEQTKKETRLSVQDFGVGITQENQEKVFNRFFRVAGSDETQFKGFGLGLYLCSEIIRKHKGKIWVESDVGNGSTFTFTLPARKIKK